MTEHEITYVKKCIRENMHRFYTWTRWKQIRKEVLELDKGECLYKSNDSASRELCEEASRQGFGYLVHVQR